MKKNLKITLIAMMLAALAGTSLLSGCILNPGSSKGVDTALIKQASNVIHEYYVEPDKLNDQQLTEGAIRGMVYATGDPHSDYLTKNETASMNDDVKGNYIGIGITTFINDNGECVVDTVDAGSPAEKSGIVVGDTILSIDSKMLTGMSEDESLGLFSGPEGSTAKLMVQHAGPVDPVEMDIVRKQMDIVSVQFEMKNDTAYIRIIRFTGRTDAELAPLLTTISQNGAKGIILDLRGNPGGLQETVVDVASHFVQSGTVLTEVHRDGTKTPYKVRSVTPKVLDLPMVVLVDENSASASEVLSGALQDWGRAVIAGAVTYGKGSVCTLVPLSDGSAIYITIARWLTPNGHLIEGKGIQPDQKVDFGKVDGVQWALDYLNKS